jgi:hypothetical protein
MHFKVLVRVSREKDLNEASVFNMAVLGSTLQYLGDLECLFGSSPCFFWDYEE